MFSFVPPIFKEEAKHSTSSSPSFILNQRYSSPAGTVEKLSSSFASPTEKQLAELLDSQKPKSADVKPGSEPGASSSMPEAAGTNSPTGASSSSTDANDDDLFAFVDPESIPPPPATSGLSQMVRTKFIHLRVFFPVQFGGQTRGVKLTLRLNEQISVREVMVAALQQMQELQEQDPQYKNGQFSRRPEHYELRVAEDDDGTPDEDLPTLDMKARLQRGFETLVMRLKNPDMNIADDGGEDDMYISMKPPKTMEDLQFTFYMSSDRKKVKRLSFPPDMVYRDLLAVLCERTKKDLKKHQLKIIVGAEERDTLPDGSIIADKTLTTLRRWHDITSFVLKRNCSPFDEQHGELDESDDDEYLDQQEFSVGVIFTEYEASKYQQFLVTKINKYGTRQERLLGIDREKIYNMMPKEIRSKFTGSVKRTMYPERLISDIGSINQPDPARQSYFEIEYKQGGNPKDRIEATNKREAQEIIMKLEFLLKIHNPNTTPRVKLAHTQPASRSKFLGSLFQALSDMTGGSSADT
eukprot:TRINITY_DN15131_c0_g1_i1.p1 TRINITY_DN15131_c0_g1~~TRINITY_DN15131_c0_g1_i1.p1  ORF type:complete len:524 (+),score=95.90 TRINITY_DN15131_c0_g1_i1:24-1595(+)